MTAACGEDWDPRFTQRSPMFSACAPAVARALDTSRFPDHERLAGMLRTNPVPVVNRTGQLLVPVAPGAAASAADYECTVAASGRLAVRPQDWHDLMNLLAWCVFPRTKAVINARHVDDLAVAPAAGAAAARRSPVRDALTLFDENGVLVASADPSLDAALRAFRWTELFVRRRDAVRRSMRFIVFGHGLLDKARAPYIGLTGHACILRVTPALLALDAPALARALDPALASAVERWRGPDALAPLPVLGVPGWWPANEDASFYDDRRYFRPGRSRRPDRPAAGTVDRSG